MAEENKEATAGAATGAANQPVFKIHRIYLKDVSYESPQTPSVFVSNKTWKPNVALHLNTESSKLENDLYECVLTVTATVKLEEEVAYLIELKQAGLFLIKGFEESRLGLMLGSFCPNVLFPFAREEIACLLYTSPSPRDGLLSRMPSSA